MYIQTWTFLIVGLPFALYIGIAIWSRAKSTKDFYVAGGGVSPLANGLATGADWMSAASFLDTLSSATVSPGGAGGSVTMPPWMKGVLSTNERLQYRGYGGADRDQRRERRDRRGGGAVGHVTPLLGKSPLAAPLPRSSAGGSSKALRSPSPQRRARSIHAHSDPTGVGLRESRSAGDSVARAVVGRGSQRRRRRRQHSPNRNRSGR